MTARCGFKPGLGLVLLAMLPGLAAGADAGWQGDWTVTRDDPRLTTRAGAELLSLQVVDQGQGALAVDWQAGRAICLDPLDEPCEWIGTRGQATVAAVSGDSLIALLRVSADDSDPFVLHLHRGPTTPIASGMLLGSGGDLRYRIEAQAAAQP